MRWLGVWLLVRDSYPRTSLMLCFMTKSSIFTRGSASKCMCTRTSGASVLSTRLMDKHRVLGFEHRDVPIIGLSYRIYEVNSYQMADKILIGFHLSSDCPLGTAVTSNLRHVPSKFWFQLKPTSKISSTKLYYPAILHNNK